MTETPINDTNAIISIIDDAIADSLGPDWNSFQAAHHVMQWLTDAGLQIVWSGYDEGNPDIDKLVAAHQASPNFCPYSHDGLHHVDTSMESGPNNCFHCEGKM